MSKRTDRLGGKVGAFIRQYGRKAQRGKQPNDRRYSREVEKAVKRLDPEDLSSLISGDQGLDQDVETRWHSHQPVADLKFGLDYQVVITSGAARGKSAVVLALVALSPAPRFLVKTGEGDEIDVLESQIEAI